MNVSVQGELFAWHCAKGDKNGSCDESGSDRAEYEQHMAGHGFKPLRAPKLMRLRKSAPRAPLAKSPVPVFKTLRWTEDGIEQRGQFWSAGARGRSVIAITYTRWNSGQRPRFVPLIVNADGTVFVDELEQRRFRGIAEQHAAPLAA